MTDGRPTGAAEVSDPDRLHSLYAATRELMAATTRSELCTAAVETTESVLDLPSVGIHLVEDGRLVPVSTTERVREKFDGDPPAYGPTHPLWSVYEDGEVVRAAETEDWKRSVAAGVAVPVGDHGILVAGSDESATVDEAGVELVRLLGTNTAVALDRLERERRLDRLHEAARELMTAGDTAAVAAAATNTAHEVLGLTVNAVFLRVSGSEKLVPVGVTAEARNVFETAVPDLGPESIAWQAYRTGEPKLHDDVRESERVEEPQTPIRSELVLPLGEHGVFVAGSTEVGVFDEEDLSLAQVFAANVEAALDSADRQAQLRRRESELQRQNERLEEFASVVSHDLRNPLNVADGNVELAQEECDSEHLDTVARALDRMDT
ncbi:MAG: GAF domain-containing protein, partial [Halobaculum sp.]